MEDLSSNENVLKLCDHIINLLDEKTETNDEFSTYVKGLQYICYGEPAGRNTLSALTAEEKLSGLMQIAEFDAFFKFCPEDCIRAAEALLCYSHLTLGICKSLQKIVTSASLIQNNKTLLMGVYNKLFNHRDFASVPVELIEEVITVDSTNVELLIINMYSLVFHNGSSMLLWNSESNKHWVTWCSRSTKLFCKLSSIMNQILLSIQNKKAFLKIINNFVDNVMFYCNENDLDFIQLYPINLQPIVTMMSLNFVDLPIQNSFHLKNYILEEINNLRQECSFKALILWSHFSKWEKLHS